ncbi:MAG: fasciclin domain-containing protein, partial [Pseudomonadota bacterium]
MFLQKLIQKIINFFHQPEPEPEPEPPVLSIAEIATENGNFDILVAALDVAGLSETFLNAGDFTVFAPTDEAFIILARDTFGLDVDEKTEVEVATMLVNLLGVPTLTRVLEYHVKLGATSLEDLQSSGTVTTLLDEDGFAPSFDVSGTTLSDADPDVEDPEFVEGLTDIQASNGVIQVIDRVLLPIDVEEATAQPTIEDIASSNEDFQVLSAALNATGLAAVVDDRSADFTVFAPTDDAFRALAEELLADDTSVSVDELADEEIAGALVAKLGAATVTDVLLYHVSPGGSSLEELQNDRLVDTALPGVQVGIDGTELIDADPQIANPNFILPLTDIEAVNGEIQAIDRVLLPFDLEPVENLRLVGTRKDDFLQGGGGNDKAFGRSGADILEGGNGNDLLAGGRGEDILDGGAGNDRLRGGTGDDLLKAGAGSDVLTG